MNNLKRREGRVHHYCNIVFMQYGHKRRAATRWRLNVELCVTLNRDETFELVVQLRSCFVSSCFETPPHRDTQTVSCVSPETHPPIRRRTSGRGWGCTKRPASGLCVVFGSSRFSPDSENPGCSSNRHVQRR